MNEKKYIVVRFHKPSNSYNSIGPVFNTVWVAKAYAKNLTDVFVCKIID